MKYLRGYDQKSYFTLKLSGEHRCKESLEGANEENKRKALR